MKSLIITVAGMSSRFNRDTKEDVLKCLYHEGNARFSLLSQQVHKVHELVDEIIVVGGYRYVDLTTFVQQELKDVNSKIRCIYNDHYFDYGSGYSLLKGLEFVSDDADEIVFIEGDLFFNGKSAAALIESTKDAISVNDEPIKSNKAVVLYFDKEYYPHYIYDTSHSCLEIHEPFTAIYNSGQMWKFRNPVRVREICLSLTSEQKQGTNLEIIQKYFGNIRENQLEIVRVKDWYNCNTIADYQVALKLINV